MHCPGGSKNGDAEPQDEHCVAAGPQHVWQLAWHGEHVSAVEGLPPEQVKPSSMERQSPLQPSVPTVFPSSHVSPLTRRPSPHIDWHRSRVPKLPPEQTKPASIWQFASQPSPLWVLLSSHCSAGLQRIRLPSPQRGAQVSMPPTPEPCAFDDVHAHPSSTRHSESQPSPPTVLLSSQTSAVDRIPLPQMWTGGMKLSDSCVDALLVE